MSSRIVGLIPQLIFSPTASGDGKSRFMRVAVVPAKKVRGTVRRLREHPRAFGLGAAGVLKQGNQVACIDWGIARSSHPAGGARLHGVQMESLPGMPLISIITATYNAAEHLPKVIKSVREQTYGNAEWIVVDGASTDRTLDILRQNEDVIDYWVSEPDKGIYDAWNKGLQLARGQWICFLGADDFLWNGDVIEKAARVLVSANPPFRVVYGRVMLIGPTGAHLHAVGEAWTPALKRRFRQLMSIPHPGTFHHISLFQDKGGFDAAYRISGDYELLLRELVEHDALFIPELVTAGMTVNGLSSTPQNMLRSLKEVRQAQKKNGISWLGPAYVSAYARAWIRDRLWGWVGETAARRFLDMGRRVMGKPPYWTKT